MRVFNADLLAIDKMVWFGILVLCGEGFVSNC